MPDRFKYYVFLSHSANDKLADKWFWGFCLSDLFVEDYPLKAVIYEEERDY